jgi:hypothetical protein
MGGIPFATGLFKLCFKGLVKEFKKNIQEAIDRGKEPNIALALNKVAQIRIPAT